LEKYLKQKWLGVWFSDRAPSTTERDREKHMLGQEKYGPEKYQHENNTISSKNKTT
jgi:hypothetical protein